MPIAADTYRPILFGHMQNWIAVRSGVPEILRFKVSYRMGLFNWHGKWPGRVLGKLAGEVMDTMLEAYRDPWFKFL